MFPAASLPLVMLGDSLSNGVLAGGVVYAATALSQFIIDNYKQILVIGCEEASKWSTSTPPSYMYTNWELESLEKELQDQGQPIHVWIFALVHQCL
jgi:hypothetical protein